MASKSSQAFRDNSADVERLLEIARSNSDGPDAEEAVHKSAIVLMTSFWEAYCEDIAAEGMVHLITHIDDFADLPKRMRQDLAAELKNSKNELAVWDLAGDGWRDALWDRFEAYNKTRTGQFNTPKPAQVDELFDKALGIPRISDTWTVRKPRRPAQQLMTAQEARDKLTEYVTLRGAIAHRGYAEEQVTYQKVHDYYTFINRIVGKTGGRVNTAVKRITGIPLWETKPAAEE